MTVTAPAPPRAPASRPPRRTPRRMRPEAFWGLAFVLPCFLLFLVFRFGPAIVGVLLAFFEYTLGDAPRFSPGDLEECRPSVSQQFRSSDGRLPFAS